MSCLSPEKWFCQLFGFEESVDAVYKNMKCTTSENGQILLTSTPNNFVAPVGNLAVRSISSYLSDPNHLPKRGGGHFNIICGNRSSTKNYDMIDALSMQSKPSNDGATYQAASNFNLLEFTSSFQTASHGVTDYVWDPTQGPRIALACPQSMVYRNYFCQHEDDPTVIGQIEKEIELLKRTPLSVNHGYAQVSIQQAKELEQTNFNWADEENYLIGTHTNCPVLLTQGPNDDFQLTEHKNIANHVYVAAFNLMYDVHSNDFTKMITEHLLKAEYKGTILSAWENSIQMEKEGRPGAKQLYLTLIGGGVFHNPKNLIAGAILSCEQLIIDSGLEVNLVCYSQNDYAGIKQFLDPLVQKTGGKIIQVD